MTLSYEIASFVGYRNIWMNATSPAETSVVIAALVIFGLYLASLVAFSIFVIREEGTSKSKLFAFLIVLVGIVVIFFNRLLGGGVMVAACFYVADHKNRSRMWALPALFLGPLLLLVLVFLPKLEDTSCGLNLNT